MPLSDQSKAHPGGSSRVIGSNWAPECGLSKSFTLVVIILLSYLSPRAQITVTNSTFPVLGDTLRMSIDKSPAGITVTPAGGCQTWDLSGVQADTPKVLIFKAASDGSMGASVAEILVDQGVL